MKVTVLGCGTSTGVPLIGCTCAVCTSEDQRDKRLRSSALIEVGESRLLVDTTPDLREQCLRFGFSTVDAVLFTHAHADHLHGIDDIRQLNICAGRPIDAFAARETMWHLETRFGYTLHADSDRQGTHHWWRPALRPHLFDDAPFETAGITVRPVRQHHGRSLSWGFKVGKMLYSSDVDAFPDDSLDALEDLDVWIVDALREREHPSHSHLERTLTWIERFKPKRAVLTHMNHEVSYAGWVDMLPSGVEPAYDGMVLELADPEPVESVENGVVRVS